MLKGMNEKQKTYIDEYLFKTTVNKLEKTVEIEIWLIRA